MKKLTVALGVALCAATLAACGSSDSDSSDGDSGDGGGTIKIGFSGDFSGLLAAYDVPVRDGMEFAVDQINAEGGEYTVDLAVDDNKGDPKLTVSQTQTFLDDGRLCMTNNAAERALRCIAVGRSNWTFAGSDAGGRSPRESAATAAATSRRVASRPDPEHAINRQSRGPH